MDHPIFHITKTRSTLNILKDTAQYISANARTLMQATTVLALPFIMAGVIISYFITSSVMSVEKFFYFKDYLDKKSFALLGISFLIYVAGIAVYNMAVNKQLLLAARNEENGVSLDKIKKGFSEELPLFAGNFIIIYAGYFIISQFVGFLFGGNFMGLNSTYSVIESFFGSFTNLVVLYVPALFVMPLCFYFCIASLFLCSRDHLSATDALKKVWGYSQNNMKKVWLTSSLAAALIMAGIYGIRLTFYPVYFAIGFSNFDSQGLMAILHILVSAMKFLVVMYFQIAAIFLFGSVEDEAEGHYIKSKIEKV